MRVLRSLDEEHHTILLPETRRAISDLETQFCTLLHAWDQLTAQMVLHHCSATAVLRSVHSSHNSERYRQRGRPRVPIDGEQLIYPYSCDFSYSQVADMHLVHRYTIWRRCQTLGIPTSWCVTKTLFGNWCKILFLEFFQIFWTTT